MAGTADQKSYTLKPSWKQHVIGYILSILAIPLAGIGFIGLYFVRKKHKSIKYIVTDSQISSIDTKYRRNTDLVNIESVEVQQSWLQNKLGIGNLFLKTSASEMKLLGIENPVQIKIILEKAINTELKRREEAKKTKPREPKYDPGSMDKMEYLTGLWQQGLISEEDYEKERKHFE